MIIDINCRLLLKNKLEGICWYTFEIVKQLVQQHPEHEFYFLFDRSFHPDFVFAKNVTPIILSPQSRHPFLWYLWFEFSVPKFLKKNNIDLFFSPDGYLSLNTNVKTLLTIHDLNFEHFPEQLPFLTRKYYQYFTPKFCKKADAIITVSQQSKKDIVKQYRIESSKISAIYNGDKYQIGSGRLLKENNNEHDLYLLKNNKIIAFIDIEDEVKKDAKSIIEKVREIGIVPILLSGDKARKCTDLSEKLNFSKVYAEQLPNEKLEKIKQLVNKNPTAMFGDGINDAPALAQATVGISISNATQVAIQTADVILLNKNELSQLPKALQVANHTLLTIKQNLFWAFAYNIVAIPIAAMGFLNPMWGALFMAFSDVIVIGNSIRLKYKKIF